MSVPRPWISFALQALLLVLVYETVGRLVPRIGLTDRDGLLVAIDAAITGGRVPLVAPGAIPSWCYDAFSAAYISYFALPPFAVVALMRRGRESDAQRAVQMLLLAFAIHYALYAIVPAVGPARTVQISTQLRTAIANEGGALTRGVRRVIGVLEGPAPDAFPSAHSSIALLVAALARRHRIRGRAVVYALAAAIVASTVALGYHYVVDVIAAIPVARAAWCACMVKSPPCLRGCFIETRFASCGPTPIRPASSGSGSSSGTSRTRRSGCSSGSARTGPGSSTN